MKATYEEIISIGDIGDAIAYELTSYMANEDNIKLINSLKELGLNCEGCPELDCECCWVKASKNHIKEVTAADVAPVRHGDWSRVIGGMTRFGVPFVLGYGCSICGFQIKITDGKTNYCPNCGADMRGVAANE